MEASELADKLDECMGHALSAEEALYPDVADIWLDKYEECCRENRETVIKSLRFAADMEVLMQEHAQPWFEDCVDGQTELRVTIQHEVRYFYGDSIYTAARKAVEALEGGK